MKDFIIDADGLTFSELKMASSGIFNGTIPDCVDISGMNKYNLTEDDVLILLAYTGSSSKWLNPELRNGNWVNDENKVVFIERLDATLSKINSFRTNTLYHMAAKNNFIAGEIIKIESYLSTSIEDFENSELKWIISPKSENSNCCNIQNITGNKYEREVLFRRGTIFEVVDFKGKNTYLKEI